MRLLVYLVLLAGLVTLNPLQATAALVMIEGGGSPRSDCLVELSAEGQALPAGVACTDGDLCDRDGVQNGVCQFSPIVCINVVDPDLPSCSPGTVSQIEITARGAEPAAGEPGAALATLGLPSTLSVCTYPIKFAVAVKGWGSGKKLGDGKGMLSVQAKSEKESDKFNLVCRPALGASPTPPTPGGGLQANILDMVATSAGKVMVTFSLTDDAGVRITPTGSSTSDPNKAQVRWLIARLETAAESPIPVPPNFTTYVNYNTSSTSGQPTFDSGGTFSLLDSTTGIYVYTYGRMLPGGFPAHLTHTVGAQIGRTFDGRALVANPVMDFVPDGSPVTVVREPVSTAQCNMCHNPLALHGGGRRDANLCKLCHTGQAGAVDPDTGNTIEFKSMIHSIHTGKNLPTIEEGPVGSIYEIIGFNSSHNVYGEKVMSCEGGPFASVPCTVDADCGVGGTCTDEKTVGVAFPQDIRNCVKCHTGGATSANYMDLPTTIACTGCHNNVNPSQMTTLAGPPGTGHAAGPRAETACGSCHSPTGAEFGRSVAGAHTIPAQSTQLAGLEAEILSATGSPGGTVQMSFRLTDGAGTPIMNLAAAKINRVRIVLDGPTSDYAGPEIRSTAFGSGSAGVLTGPDPSGVFSYETAATLPGGASGSWSVGMEARRSVDLLDPFGFLFSSISENAVNPVFHFSVDGSALESRRQVVDTGKCANCHGTPAQGFSFHGGSRNQVAMCVLCHTANGTDFAVRAPVVISANASPVNEPITFKHMIHKIHTGEELTQKPYIIYGNSSSVHEFSEVLFPGNRADCETCHVNDSNELPLPDGLLPTIQSVVNMGSELVTGSIPPIQDACLTCHDSVAAVAHAQSNTASSGNEGCLVCHGEGKIAPVSVVHAEHVD